MMQKIYKNMKKHLHFKSFLKKHHCHGAKHLKQVITLDGIDGNQYDRLINAVEDYANEKTKQHVLAAVNTIPNIDKQTIINAYPFDNIK